MRKYIKKHFAECKVLLFNAKLVLELKQVNRFS